MNRDVVMPISVMPEFMAYHEGEFVGVERFSRAELKRTKTLSPSCAVHAALKLGEA